MRIDGGNAVLMSAKRLDRRAFADLDMELPEKPLRYLCDLPWPWSEVVRA